MPQKIQLKVNDSTFFSSLKVYAVVQGSLYEIFTDESMAYFNFDTGRTSPTLGPNQKTEQHVLTLKYEGQIIAPQITSQQTLTTY